jgi:5-carboxymethyl-2-hydroxymuconate isomerase
MPHFTIEHSSNLDGPVDIGRLCRVARDAILASGLFEEGAVRVRAVESRHHAIADLDPRNGFIDMSFRIGRGRSDAQKKAAGEAIFSAVAKELGPLFETPHFALSLEIREIDAELSWKRNAMHDRLRKPSV